MVADFPNHQLLQTLLSQAQFGSSTLCVGDPAATIVNCEGQLFLEIIHVNGIIVDFNAIVEIDIKLLMELVVVIQFQICQIVETIRLNNTEVEFVIDKVELRCNQKMESKVFKACGTFIQVIDPIVVIEHTGEPVYVFQSGDLHALAALSFSLMSLDDNAWLPPLQKKTDWFPYRLGGVFNTVEMTSMQLTFSY